MRYVLISIGTLFVAAASHGCSETNCAPNEIKVADDCYPRKDHSDGGAGVSGAEDGLQDGSSRVPLSADAAVSDPSPDRFVPMASADSGGRPTLGGDTQADGGSDATCFECEDIRSCVGELDANLRVTCWIDNDGDGYAASTAATMTACGQCPIGWTAREPRERSAIDCDDELSATSPGSTDICGDGIDNDCDGDVDEEMKNACGGRCTVKLAGPPGESCSNKLKGACSRNGVFECQPDGTSRCSAPTVQPATEKCNQQDDDCDGEVDEGVKNACGECGVVPAEVCDGVDNNCNGQVDEGSMCPEGHSCQAGKCAPNCGNGKIDHGEDCESGVAGWDSIMCDRTTCLQRIYQTVCTSDRDCLLGKCGGGLTTRRYCIPVSVCGNGPNGMPDASECPDLPGFEKTCAPPNACFVACKRDVDCPRGLICMPNTADQSWPGYCVGE